MQIGELSAYAGQMGIALLGGTFDPIHKGHVYIAKQVVDRMNVPRVALMPAGQPPHKQGENITAAAHRWNMVQLVAQKHDFLCTTDIELKQNKPCYTVETLLDIHKYYQGKILLVIGGDSLLAIQSWYRYKEIFALADIAAVYRPGQSASKQMEQVAQDLAQHANAKITLIDCQGTDISASRLREGIAAGADMTQYLEPEVWQYIQKEGLYRSCKHLTGSKRLFF